jgi:hypothetical protein
MRIYGLDFTSAPKRSKPMFLCRGNFGNNVLEIEGVKRWESFEELDHFLESPDTFPGPYVLGMDFPFGFPREFLDAVHWSRNWEAYVGLLWTNEADRGRTAFKSFVDSYRAGQPAGRKEHFRETDRLFRAQSPMKFVNPPVAFMFFEGAPRLARADVSVLPVRPTHSNRIVLEAYPAAAVKALGLEKADKSTPSGRQSIVDAINCNSLKTFGFQVHLGGISPGDINDDKKGDLLDSIICALQAAWGTSQRNNGWGLPVSNVTEGGIASPKPGNAQSNLARSV